MSVRVRILGCGSSGGVPRVGPSGWGLCDPDEPRNRRRRCAILVEREGPGGVTTVLVDAGPDLREQLLDAGTQRLDALILTHAHADHIHGLDDVRPLVISSRRRIAAHMDASTSERVHAGFGYLFATPPGSNYPPLLDEARVEPPRPISVQGLGGVVEVTPFRVHHGEIDALGLRFGAIGHFSWAYTPDLIDAPAESLPFLEGLNLWIVDALRPAPHPSHFHLELALEWIARMKPKRAVLTNLHSDMDYRSLRARLPAHIQPAYDGMTLDFPM